MECHVAITETACSLGRGVRDGKSLGIPGWFLGWCIVLVIGLVRGFGLGLGVVRLVRDIIYRRGAGSVSRRVSWGVQYGIGHVG